jgi:hypothetical protein
MIESKDQALTQEAGEQVLRSFHEWMVQQAHAAKSTNQSAQFLDVDNPASRKGSNFSPSIASQHSIKSFRSASPELSNNPRQDTNIPPVASNRPSAGKRVLRTIVRGLLVAIVVTVGWQAYREDQTRKLINALGHSSVIWLSSALSATKHNSESAAEPSTKLSDQVTSTPATTSIPAKGFAELEEQLQTIVTDLAVLRSDVEQLSSKQEQMARDIATVQATEQNVSEKVSSLTLAAPINGPPRKNVPRLVHVDTPRQPAVASPPPQTSRAGTASPTDQPPRPPLPLPSETPSPLH